MSDTYSIVGGRNTRYAGWESSTSIWLLQQCGLHGWDINRDWRLSMHSRKNGIQGQAHTGSKRAAPAGTLQGPFVRPRHGAKSGRTAAAEAD